MAKSTIWYVLQKKEHRNIKKPGRTQKQHSAIIHSLVKKKKHLIIGQIKNTLQEVGITVKRSFQHSSYREFATRCKPLASLKFAKKKTAKKPIQAFLEQHLMDRCIKYQPELECHWEMREPLIIQSTVPYPLSMMKLFLVYCVSMAANGTGINLLWTESSRITTDVCHLYI